MSVDANFYKNKNVLVTGHTGFKGTWLCMILQKWGANVTGYSLEPSTNPSLFKLSEIECKINSITGDVRNLEQLKDVFNKVQPEIVFHLAAQPIVRDSYKIPVYTYETNVMGTVNIMECIRVNPCVKSVVNVTTDKVYKNNEWCWGYREDEPLGGFDPYSNSKACSELVTQSYKSSFFDTREVAVSTARAGNVIGGGDFANDRIIPDCVRAMFDGKVIEVRNPHSIRPYQHVLEPLAVYLEIAEKQYDDKKYQGYYNVGPDDCDCVSTGELVNMFCSYWGESAQWECKTEKEALHEANYLKLDCSKVKAAFGWKPRWHIEECMDLVCRFSKTMLLGGDVQGEMCREIDLFFERG